MTTYKNKFTKVAIIGGGTIGSSWAALFLAKGLQVTIYDPDSAAQSATRKLIANAWPALIELGLTGSAQTTGSNQSTTSTESTNPNQSTTSTESTNPKQSQITNPANESTPVSNLYLAKKQELSNQNLNKDQERPDLGLAKVQINSNPHLTTLKEQPHTPQKNIPNLSNLHFTDDLSQAIAGADFVQENAPENESFKIDLFAQMDAIAPADVILASSSSGLLMSRIQSKCHYPERCVIGHPFNPPHLIPLIEVVGGAKTSAAAIDAAMEFYRFVGKSPIKINKEVVGHIANRLQSAVWREAIYLAQQGVASLEDIDKAISEGPGLRWAIFGPSMTFNLGGGEGGMAHFLDHLGDAVKSWWDDLGTVELNDESRQVLLDGLQQASAGRTIDDLVKQRDQTLLRLLAAKYKDN